jgi:hypothetical protein
MPKIKEVLWARNRVVADQLQPYIDRNGYWDGISATDRTGRVRYPCTKLRKQMKKLITEGYYGPVDRLLIYSRNGRLHRRVIHLSD